MGFELTGFQTNLAKISWVIAQDWLISFFSGMFKALKINDFDIEFTSLDEEGVSLVEIRWALGQREDSDEGRVIDYQKRSRERYKQIEKARSKREHDALMKEYNRLKKELDERAKEIVARYQEEMHRRLEGLTEDFDFSDFEIRSSSVDLESSPPTVTYSVVIK